MYNQYYLLDFTGVENNDKVREQGKLICIKTKTKGYFSPKLERYVSRQDLAIITMLIDDYCIIGDDVYVIEYISNNLWGCDYCQFCDNIGNCSAPDELSLMCENLPTTNTVWEKL